MCSRAVFLLHLKRGMSITCNDVNEIEKLPFVAAEEGRQHLLENLHLKVIRKLSKIFEGPWQIFSKAWKTEGIPVDLKTLGTGLVFENDERNDTGSYQIIILTDLVRKYRAMGFGRQNKE